MTLWYLMRNFIVLYVLSPCGDHTLGWMMERSGFNFQHRHRFCSLYSIHISSKTCPADYLKGTRSSPSIGKVTISWSWLLTFI